MSMTIDELYELVKAAREAGHGKRSVFVKENSLDDMSLVNIQDVYTDKDNDMILEVLI